MPAPVILLHGLRTSATMWRQQVEALEARGIPTYAVDLPGHGTRLNERFTLPLALAAVDAAVGRAAAETGEKPYLVGFSLGGYLSIEWAATEHHRIAGLLAASCATTPHPVIMVVWRMLAKGIHLFPDRGRALNDAVVRLFVPTPGSQDVLAGGVALEVMDDVLRDLSTLRPLTRLPEIDVPVLFVNGALDHIRIEARRYLAATPNARLVTVPRATHMVNVTHPAAFTDALLDGYRDATGPTAPRGSSS